jgi:hypothetical protein
VTVEVGVVVDVVDVVDVDIDIESTGFGGDIYGLRMCS